MKMGAHIVNLNQVTNSPVFTGTITLPNTTLAAASDELTLTNGPDGSAGNPAVYAVVKIDSASYFFPLWAVPAMMESLIVPNEEITEEKPSLTTRVLTGMKNLLSSK